MTTKPEQLTKAIHEAVLKRLNSFSCWLYKKTSTIPAMIEVRSNVVVNGEVLQIQTIMTNKQVSYAKDLHQLFELDFGMRIQDLVQKASDNVGQMKALQLFSGKRVFETPYLPEDQIFVGTGEIGNTPWHPNFDMTDVKMKED